MTDHPITPSPELIKDWHDEWKESDQIVHSAYTHIAIRAAQWGADQELEACCELVRDNDGYDAALGLLQARRPKPPSLKEQALAILDGPHRNDLVDDEWQPSAAHWSNLMTDYKATPEQWAQCEDWVRSSVVGASDACILELRARVETLEAAAHKHIVETRANILALASRVEALELAERKLSKVLDISDLPQWTPEQAQKLKDLLGCCRNHLGLNE